METLIKIKILFSHNLIRRIASSLAVLFYFAISPHPAYSQSVTENEINPWEVTSESLHHRTLSLLNAMTIEEKASQLLFESPAIERLGVTEYNWWNEALHGVARSGKATVFPQAIGLGATFDKDLIYRVASAISDEARIKYNEAIAIGNRGRYAGLTFWSPNVNIFRDPRWGRGQETYGEDPILTAQLGLAFVKGLQGENPKYLKTAACAKHYVVHSGPEALRHEFDAVPPIKDFYETYLPAFDTLVRRGKVAGVMCAYNRTFGEPCCGSPFLDLEILRDDWKFEGYHVSDCWAINDIHQNHKYTNTVEESVALSLENEIDLNCGSSYRSLMDAYNQKLITESQIDTSLYRLIKIRVMLGMFDPPGSSPYDLLPSTGLNSEKNIELAREAAVKSIVMLKNDGVLPLDPNMRSLFVTGPFATDTYVSMGNYYGMSGNIVTILEGLTNTVSPGTSIVHNVGFLPFSEINKPNAYLAGTAHRSDAIVIVLGTSCYLEGEEGDAIASKTKGDRLDLSLPKNQIDFLKQFREKGDKPIIAVVMGGSPAFMEEVHENADAVLWVWYPGEQGGTAVADVIFGKENPSGRLPISFPGKEQIIPAFEDYAMHNRTYRYFDEEPFYPFGFGLSFSKFSYSDLSVNEKTITVSVKNESDFEGEEVVQLYLNFSAKGIELPKYALKAFRRVLLKPGETRQIQFRLTNEMLVYYDNEGKQKKAKKEITVFVGGGCPSPRIIEFGGSNWVMLSTKF